MVDGRGSRRALTFMVRFFATARVAVKLGDLWRELDGALATSAAR